MAGWEIFNQGVTLKGSIDNMGQISVKGTVLQADVGNGKQSERMYVMMDPE